MEHHIKRNYGIIALAMVIALLGSSLVVNPYREAEAIGWTSIKNTAGEQPTAGLILNGIYYVWSPNTVTSKALLYGFSAQAPYSQIGVMDVSSLCGAVSTFPNAIVSYQNLLFIGCGSNIIEATTTLGLVNSTSTPAQIVSITTSANTVTGIGIDGHFYSYEGKSFVKCGTNPADCGGISFNQNDGCTQYERSVVDIANNRLYVDCFNPVEKVYKFVATTLVFSANWAVDAMSTTAESDMAVDQNGLIWHEGNNGIVKVYNNAGALQQTITMPAGFGHQVDQQSSSNGQIYWFDVGQSNVVVYFKNFTQFTISSVATQDPSGERSTLQVTGGLVFFGGSPSNGVVIAGSPTGQGAGSNGFPNGGGSGGNNPSNGCPNTTVNCGDTNCLLPQNINLLMCRNGNSALNGTGQFVGTSVNNLLTGSGIINSTNTNPKTNGTGYFVTAVAFGILVVMFYLGSGGELGKIPTFVWFIASLSLVGAMVSIGLLDATFLIVAILIIIALASAKILSTLDIGRF